MHPLNPVLSTAVISEINDSRRHDASPRAGEKRGASRIRTVRARIAARRGPASAAQLGSRPTVRAGRA